MAHSSAALALRAKILGTLIRDARKTNGKSIEECSQAIGISVQQYQAFEEGRQAPSLPELEGLAFFLETPLEHFWSSQTLGANSKTKTLPDIARLMSIRNRMIGALLRQSRLDSQLSLEEASESIKIEVDTLNDYELGLKSAPLPELEALSDLFNRSIREFRDQHGPVGSWDAQQRALSDFLDLPDELQTFVSKPVNRPYLELAQRLSKMSVDKLRSVAEILLEITY